MIKLGKVPSVLLLLVIRAYQKTAPLRPPLCIYSPTCSEYTAQAILQHGLVRGFALGVRRVLRCTPFSAGGHDPVPQFVRQSSN